MARTVQARQILKVLTYTALIPLGCSSGDERLVELSQQSSDRQAEQNRLVETNNRQIVEATQRLAERDMESQKQNVQLQQGIQQERSAVGRQRDILEQERRQIADERIRDPILANSILAVAGLIAAILPLTVCTYLARRCP